MFLGVFIRKYVSKPRYSLLRNVGNFIQTQSSQSSIKDNLNQKVSIRIKQEQFYRQPSFYKYFEQFLSNNNFNKNIPEELKIRYQNTLAEFEEIHEISSINSSKDDEFINLAKEESLKLIEDLVKIQDLILEYVCVDDRDVNECSFEIRAGVGGKEASLFAQELYNFYIRFIPFNGWDVKFNKEEFDQIGIDDNTSLLTQSIEINGIGCYHLLRHEAGVHRVQRVPKTEKYGRIHTSTVSVSVIPIRNNLVQVKESDLKFEVKNSSGAGGQNVNRNLTCVRCTHIPTGLTVESQETRFQYMNKEIAIRKMKALLNQMEYDRLEREARQQKRAQIGISARSDKIRTYNFPQNRITDHRLTNDDGNTIYNIEGYFNGQEFNRLKSIIQKLESQRQLELMNQIRTLLERQFKLDQMSSQ